MWKYLTLTAALALVACGGGGGGTTDAPHADAHGDAAHDAPKPTGAFTHYVINTVAVPSSTDEATLFALDVGGPTSNAQDGSADNQLGRAMAALGSDGIGFKALANVAVNRGTFLLLADIQAASFTGSGAASFQTFLGDNPVPPPCDGTGDTVCGHQFVHGMFGLGSDSASSTPLEGTLAGGVLAAGPADTAFQIAFSVAPVTVTLHNARVRASGITSDAITGAVIDGAVLKTDVDTELVPALAAEITTLVMANCTALTSPPACGCAAGSTGAGLIAAFDGDTGGAKDCAVSAAEILGNTQIASALSADVCSSTSCAQPDALSFGAKLSAVAATFTVPGE